MANRIAWDGQLCRSLFDHAFGSSCQPQSQKPTDNGVRTAGSIRPADSVAIHVPQTLGQPSSINHEHAFLELMPE